MPDHEWEDRERAKDALDDLKSIFDAFAQQQPKCRRCGGTCSPVQCLDGLNRKTGDYW